MTEKKRSNTIYWVIVAVLILAVIGGIIAYNSKFGNDILNRASYGIDKYTFENLPSVPDDFNWIDSQVELGMINEKYFNQITEEYWKQPEFYPNFEKAGLTFYKNPYKDRRACYGYGAYPQTFGYVISQNNLSVGTEVYAKTWLHTGYGILCYQGSQLIPIISSSTSEYFDLKIEPNNFLMMPTYPKFDKDWAREIRVIVTVKKTPVPQGTYTFGFLVTAPTKQQSDDWKWEYRDLYVDSGLFSSTAKTFEYILRVQ